MASALAQRLREARPERFTVTCLPDFFVDVNIAMPPWPIARDQMQGIVERKGGNLLTPAHRVMPGGNAGNTALALARLGVRARLITSTDPFGAGLARQFLAPHGVDLGLVRDDGALASTVALEFGPDRRNVMLSHSGSVASFGPEALRDEDWAAIEGSDAVLVANWNQNRHGTALATRVLERAARAGALTFFDAGDPSMRASEVPQLFGAVLASPHLRVLGCNENELAYFAAAAGDVRSKGLLERAQAVRREVSATLDVHTRDLAVSLGERGAVAEAKPPPLEGRRATGAGDTWNAGDLLGHLLGLPPEERLALANAVATAYVTRPEPLHPTLAEVADLLARL